MTAKPAVFTPTRFVLFCIAVALLSAPQASGQALNQNKYDSGQAGKYPGVPVIKPGQFHPAGTVARFQKATIAAVSQDLWQPHLDAIESALVKATRTRSLTREAQRYEQLSKSDLVRLMLAQSAFIRFVTPESLANLCKDDYKRPFFEWLLLKTEAIESFVISIKPEEDIEQVLSLWRDLWEMDHHYRDKYHSLALACALVFDRPVHDAKMKERYVFFRDSAEKRKLKTKLDRLPAWELVWVVDAPVPESELVWAQENVRISRQGWSAAYKMIAYRLDKVVGGKQIHDEYTLAEIRKKGGICTDQAYFAAISAKANGIPAMQISGEGDRGAHAWFGYKASPRKWNMEGGRYSGDSYAAGTARDPQTGKMLTEHKLKIMADGQRVTTRFHHTNHLMWFGKLFMARQLMDKAGVVLELAINAGPQHVPAWNCYLNYLEKTSAPSEKWQEVLRRMRSAFRKHPDMLARARELEARNVLADQEPDEASKTLKRHVREARRGGRDRSDLILKTIAEQIRVLSESGDTNAVAVTYKKALKSYGHEVVPFRSLANNYFRYAEEHGIRSTALRDIDTVFRRYHHAPSRDYFAMTTHVRLLKMMAGFYKQDDQQRKAERYEKKAKRLKQEANRRYSQR